MTSIIDFNEYAYIDVVLCFSFSGVKVMFRIALVLFKLTLGTPEKLAECPTLYETMEKLRHIPHELIDGDFISKEVSA